jgi:hypothetical protein
MEFVVEPMMPRTIAELPKNPILFGTHHEDVIFEYTTTTENRTISDTSIFFVEPTNDDDAGSCLSPMKGFGICCECGSEVFCVGEGRRR